ncbi:MAG: sialate O-acetylesterase [Verrucomicrobiales bacterium]|nr:sialate O-acetylesterase [Verrucomicrobiales bacterium]
MKKFYPLSALLAVFLGQAVHAEDLKLADIFTDHAVLQRGIAVPIWGWTEPGSKVAVNFAGQQHTATSDASGKWQVKLDPMDASATGSELTVSSDGSSVAISDVLVGEVWHASGQSNMAGQASSRANRDHPRGQAALEAVQNPSIRFCNLIMHPSGVPQEDLPAELRQNDRRGEFQAWTPASAETYSQCSAIALFFAKELQSRLNVPVGIIATPKGGAMIEMFVPVETYKKLPSFHDGRLGRIEGQNKLDNFEVTSIYNSRFHPIVGYGIAGMIWYQGESNTRSDANDYAEKLSLMVGDLRELWGQGDFPFYYVQLCAHGADEKYNDLGWPIVQDQMRLALEKIPNAGMAITNDINGHHPTNKLDGGERLAAWALANTYKQDIPHCGPLYAGHTVNGNQVTVTFNHSDSGLMLCDKEGLSLPVERPNETSKMFELAGEDETWHPAEAKLVGGTVELSSAAVPNPKHVRYAFRESLSGPRVYNRDGFPMSTFTSQLLESDLAAQTHYLKHIHRKRLEEKRGGNTDPNK